MGAARKRPGRPRSDASRNAILAAAFGELQERGFEAFAIEPVAARAGVGKATIYRWWESRAALAVECFFNHTQTELRFPDLGSARADFEQQILQLGALLRGPLGKALLSMMIGAKSDPVLARAFLTRWVLPRKAWGVERLERAIRDGECATELDIYAALDLFYGPLYSRLLVGFAPPDDAYVRRMLTVAFSAVFRRTGVGLDGLLPRR
jgi:AcrR family transcriptional regulator